MYRRANWKHILALVTIVTISFLSFTYTMDRLADQDLISKIQDHQLVTPKNIPTIIYWTSYFAEDSWPTYNGYKMGLVKCKNNCKCFTTQDKRYFHNSSAVVFHGWAKDLKRSIRVGQLFRKTNQKWIYLNQESPVRTVKYSFIPKLHMFDWIMTYKFNSDILFKYGEVIRKGHGRSFDPKENHLEGRTKLAMTVISNCRKDRMNLLNKLKKYSKIDIFGACGKPCVNCFSKINEYKFYLAFENSLCVDYITEKTYYQSLHRGIVPVVLSGANLSNPRVLPPGSYIDASSFDTARELAEYLEKVGNDPSLYNRFFEWRAHWEVNAYEAPDASCLICEKLHKSTSKRLYTDINTFYTLKDCIPYKVW
jgi:hypothetical protein